MIPNHRLLLTAAMFASFVLSAPAAAVSSAFGEAVRDDFEGYALGPLSLQFCNGVAFATTQPDDCLGILSGGSIALGTPQFPATSGTQVYAGTDMLFDIAVPFDYFWPGVSFTLHSGDNPVNVNIEYFDFDVNQYLSVFQFQLPAGFSNINVFAGTDAVPVTVHRFTLQSDSLFAIDDLQMGLETVMPGIPEPATWLMMIVGFGAVGVSLRRRVARQSTPARLAS